MQPDIVSAAINAVLLNLRWLLPVLLVIGALRLLFEAKLKGAAGEAAVSKRLRELGSEVLDDIVIPDGRGGLTQLDHVVLTRYGFLVVETKNYGGMIFGQERDKQWTQRMGRKSFRMRNPLHQNYGHVQALKALTPDIPVFGRVVFAGSAEFPKGIPYGVSTLRSLADDFSSLRDVTIDQRSLQAAWNDLKTLMRYGKNAGKEHMEHIENKHGKSLRVPVASGMLFIAALISLTFLS
ncbi:MAG: hypothetical protein C0631_07655 [Sedimenticola sp.]|nr:MAG: hypothetical protein C0631_07655 [Sedimenticola sp.]